MSPCSAYRVYANEAASWSPGQLVNRSLSPTHYADWDPPSEMRLMDHFLVQPLEHPPGASPWSILHTLEHPPGASYTPWKPVQIEPRKLPLIKRRSIHLETEKSNSTPQNLD